MLKLEFGLFNNSSLISDSNSARLIFRTEPNKLFSNRILVAHESFGLWPPLSTDDLHTGGILQGSQIHDTLLEEFLEGHKDVVNDEHCVSSTDGWPVGKDHTGFGGHAASMRPGS